MDGYFSMHPSATPVGQAVRTARTTRGWKLSAVSPHVSVSMISAIERGQRLPSITTLDALTDGFAIQRGSFDYALLASWPRFSDRLSLVTRLLDRCESYVSVQRMVYHLWRGGPTMSDRFQMGWLLTDVWVSRRRWFRVAVMLQALSDMVGDQPWPIPDRGVVMERLGKAYLHIQRPQDAVTALREAVRFTEAGDLREAALCNLGLAWWQLGHSDRAKQQWHRVVEEGLDPIRIANAHLGLGNLAMRERDWNGACRAYETALTNYDAGGADGTYRVRALNNLMVAYLRSEDWTMFDQTYLRATQCESAVNSVISGELCATVAEAAWMRGRHIEAKLLIKRAKEALGNVPTLSWFTVRLLEMQVSNVSDRVFEQTVDQIEHNVLRLSDSQRRTAILISVARVALDTGRDSVARQLLLRMELSIPI